MKPLMVLNKVRRFFPSGTIAHTIVGSWTMNVLCISARYLSLGRMCLRKTLAFSSLDQNVSQPYGLGQAVIGDRRKGKTNRCAKAYTMPR